MDAAGQIQCRPDPALYARPTDPRQLPGLALLLDAWTLQNAGTAYNASIATWSDVSGNGRHATQATGASQPKFLRWDGANYLRLSGVAGNYVSTPHTTALSLTGDMDLLVKFAPAVAWNSFASDYALIAKRPAAATTNYQFYITTSGALGFVFTDGATLLKVTNSTQTLSANLSGSGAAWLRCTWANSTNNLSFYTSLDGINWSQLGTSLTVANTQPIQTNTAALEVGSFAGGTANVMSGRVFYAEVRNGIGGPVVAAFDASRGNANSSAITDAQGNVWTINRSGNDPARIVSAPEVASDGTDDFMQAPQVFASGPYTVVFGARLLNIAAQTYVIGSDGLSTGGGVHLGQRSSSQFTVAHFGADSNYSIAADSNAAIFSASYTAPGSAVWKNGLAYGTNAAPLSLNNTAVTNIFKGYSGSPFGPAGITSIAVYSRVLSTPERRAVDRWINSRMNNVVTLS